MRTFLIGILVGLLVGAALVFFLLGGVPRAAKAPGEPIKPPDPQAQTTSAQVVIKQDLLNQVLQTIFKQMQPPSFPLQIAAEDKPVWPKAIYALDDGCVNQIQLLAEGSGVTTGVQFKDGRISAPIAFRGSYPSAFGCLNFQGWAQAHLDLRFDANQQAVYGVANIDTVNLDGVNPVVGGGGAPPRPPRHQNPL
jgi:hypothetical protein